MRSVEEERKRTKKCVARDREKENHVTERKGTKTDGREDVGMKEGIK